MTAWTNYVKQYAKDKGITYKNALNDPACASSYKSVDPPWFWFLENKNLLHNVYNQKMRREK
jgi:hypothetical protein